MNSQNTHKVMMVRPVNFGFNPETAASNAFQQKQEIENLNEIAQEEFDYYVDLLEDKGIEVIVIEDSENPIKPDAIFPNNWISMHEDGKLILYPMQAQNRRLERRQEIIDFIKSEFDVKEIIDLTEAENNGFYLEGTGSIVFDHTHKKAFACLSPRTDKNLLEALCEILAYKSVSFIAKDQNNQEIYHTNVMMCVGEKYCIVCLESIKNVDERNLVIEEITNTGRAIIEISLQQMGEFAGNMLELKNESGAKFLIMSKRAFLSLDENQKTKIQEFVQIIHPELKHIEKIGGGSARCMLAEIFLSEKH
jgi:hypothetical protein